MYIKDPSMYIRIWHFEAGGSVISLLLQLLRL
jgi:hypothetical protein